MVIRSYAVIFDRTCWENFLLLPYHAIFMSNFMISLLTVLLLFLSRCRLFGFFVVALFCCHCGYLSFVRFDYGYNMKASVTVGE